MTDSDAVLRAWVTFIAENWQQIALVLIAVTVLSVTVGELGVHAATLEECAPECTRDMMG